MKRRFAAAGVATAIGVAVFAALSSQPAGPAREAVSTGAVQPLGAGAARELLAGGALLVDVREPAELAETGKLAGALNVPLTRLKQGWKPAELHGAARRPLILYCRSGRRSGEAGEILLGQGFRQVYNLGGFEDAVKAGLPAA